MKRFIPLDKLFDQVRTRRFGTWFDKITFFRIFLIWAITVAIFGLIYFFFSNESASLFYTQEKGTVDALLDNVYFSFVTATSTGFGDIVPLGFFKFMSVFEVVFGLMLFAFVTSKLVSIKQDVLLGEIYEISFNEKINRLRSSLLLFRQNLNRIINKIEDNSIRKRELHDVYLHLSMFEDALNEIASLIDTPGKSHLKKVLDPLNTELIFNSVLHSFERLNELINEFYQKKLDLSETALNLVKRCISLSDDLFVKLDSSSIPNSTADDLKSRRNNIIGLIKSRLDTGQSG